MIVEYIRYELTSPPAAFEAAYAEAGKSLAASPHCLGWELARATDSSSQYILRIEWDSAAGHLDGFRQSAEFQRFFVEIGPFAKDIVEMRHYAITSVRSRSIADAFGGPEQVMRLARELHRRLRADPLLGARFLHPLATHVPHLGLWLSEVFGGPALYTALVDDLTPMLARHANLDVSEAERARFVVVASEAIHALAPAGAEGARASEAMVRYFEWGSHVAVENARRDHTPDAQALVPRWDWES
jgi:hemoglobin